MSIISSIGELVEGTLFIDTHEHLIEESRRLEWRGKEATVSPFDGWMPPFLGYKRNDWPYLFLQYSLDDLLSAGMTAEETYKVFGLSRNEVSSRDKWRIVEPYFEKTKNTGYLQALRITFRELFDEEEVYQGSVERVDRKMEKLVQKGFYKKILHDFAGVESAQVNALDAVFYETEYPELLYQDLSFVAMSTELDLTIAQPAGIEPIAIEDWHSVIDWHFETYGPRAIALKNQSAYVRRLNYAPVSKNEAAPLFARLAKGKTLSEVETEALGNHLFNYYLHKAADYKLPVKLHTGYYAGVNHMPLDRLRRNTSDICPVIQAHPQVKFILMHMGYPYQDEYIALAKHFSNVYIDLCWAWIINPVASGRFLKEALLAAPASKFFAFGGDYVSVETIVGHARLARDGITRALSELVTDGYFSEQDAHETAQRIMRDNALEVFDFKGALAAWH